MLNGWRRSVVAGVVVLGVYVGLAFLNSPRGFLGTDTGGKVATFEAMTASGRFDPDLGYWAERWDPEGRLHPIGYTSHTSSGRWVNVTTLPALWVGWQLYQAGGYRLALAVPMAGSLAAAFAGLALLRRLGVRPDGWWAWGGFAVLALASPLTIYALDFWEHSLGVALVAWAIVLLSDAVSGASAFWRLDGAAAGVTESSGGSVAGSPWAAGAGRTAAAGLLFGAAATMRTESLVYLAVAGSAATVLLGLRARPGVSMATKRAVGPFVGALAVGPILLVAAAVPLVLNEVVERRVVGSTIRATRVLGTAASVGDLPTDRLREAAVTLVGLEGSHLGLVLGLILAGVLVFAATRADAGLATVATAAAGALLVVRGVVSGLGFVPGLAAAWILPTHTFGGADAETSASARPYVRPFVLAVALGAVPIVLATQLRGGAAPQWAGRYLLPSGLLLATAGWAALATTDRRRLAGATAALAVAVTGFGIAWTGVRTHDVARTIAVLERRPEPVLVSDVYHLAREGGATYGDKRWLTLTDRQTDAPRAAAVLAAADLDTFASVEQATATSDRLVFPGFHPTTRTTLRLFDGVDLRVTSWRTDAP